VQKTACVGCSILFYSNSASMLVLIGYVVILGAVFGGFALAGGHLGSLIQPVELLMIFGAAAGARSASPIPGKVIKGTLKALPTVLQGSKVLEVSLPRALISAPTTSSPRFAKRG
jgi:flagellar motor component MotA